MKTLLLSTLLMCSGIVCAKSAPDFREIFREIKATNTATAAIEVRESYLDQMRDLDDFDRLSDLEQLSDGEHYFDHYRKALSGFIVKNVNEFMLDRHSDREQDIFARNLGGKMYSSSDKSSFLVKGLYYVEDCDDFKSYLRMSGASKKFKRKYKRNYCDCGGFGSYTDTFELISNITLREGEYKVIYLPEEMDIQKLIFSVNGIGRDVYFDVMVNGDIKGTIYAPGRDPSYIINVQDSANSITLRSFYGNAHIESIKVQY